MSDSDQIGCGSAFGLTLVIAIATFLAGFFTGRYDARVGMEQQAIKAGVGEYYLDGSHERQFRWTKESVNEAENKPTEEAK